MVMHENANANAAESAIASITGARAPKQHALNQLSTVGQGSGSGSGSIWSQLLSNPFFTAGFGLAGLGAAARYGSRALSSAASLIKHRMLVDVEITRHDKSYPWILDWMTRQYHTQLAPPAHPSRLGIVESLIRRRWSPRLHHLQIDTQVVKSPAGSDHTTFALVPGHGSHILRYKNAFIAVSRERVERSQDSQGRPFETLKLTTLYHYRHVFEDILRESHEMANRSVEGKTVVYTSHRMAWEPSGEPKRRRPFQSVVLQHGLAERILHDIREFQDARTWYLDRGIPYRRGYLLYGPPGTGKTSFVQALAGEMDCNIAMLSLSQRGLTDDLLNQLLVQVPPRTIVLLEDADAAFSNRQQVDSHGYSGANVTYSGLLNALDGVASAEERIIFMTTNHLDRLDDALIRPGRVDMTLHLGHATEDQMERLWDRFYAEHDRDGSGRRRFIDKARKHDLVDKVSTAALQGLFVYNKGHVEGAIAMVDQLAALRPGQQKSP
ncbi:hypothetical protein AC579_9405 [Pseudocercospora musae]|uniref:AAA+ ATPase domain-containing protein n=1 Tax=Pseudocercospora musae TaxID=113226 RepID=A0A139HHE1_9PEZI|nr:hypothetical protein AC579_9405 [Pseudocercospora musae]